MRLSLDLGLGSVALNQAPSYDADATAWFAANVSGGGTDPDAATKQIISDFYAGLKADSLYTLIDRMNLVAAHDSYGARLDLKDKATLMTPVGSPTFTAFRGYYGDGVGAYVNTNWNSITPGTNHAQDSAGLTTYINATSSDVGNLQASLGRITSVISFIRHRITTSNTMSGRINGNVTKEYGVQTTRLGFRSINRTLSNLTRGYGPDGLQSGTDETGASMALVNENFLLFRLQNTYASDRIAFWAAHSGFDATQTLAFRNRIVTLLTALGAN